MLRIQPTGTTGRTSGASGTTESDEPQSGLDAFLNKLESVARKVMHVCLILAFVLHAWYVAYIVYAKWVSPTQGNSTGIADADGVDDDSIMSYIIMSRHAEESRAAKAPPHSSDFPSAMSPYSVAHPPPLIAHNDFSIPPTFPYEASAVADASCDPPSRPHLPVRSSVIVD
ncbi:hypothetical protein AAVH_01180 [Aphelenchoides avenae]|nr:hypothetical protein AAVH_01180 [Aphelenchus avenae]